MIITNNISNVISSVISNVTGNKLVEEPTYYWEFNGASYGIVPVLKFNSDYTFSFNVYWSGQNYAPFLWGGAYFRAATGGKIQFSMVGTTSTAILTSGIVNTIEVARTGSVVTITVNGVTETFSSASTSSFYFTRIGKRVGVTNYFSGYIYNLKGTGADELYYISTTFNYPMNEAYSDEHIFYDLDNGVYGTKYNDVADDYTTVEPGQ